VPAVSGVNMSESGDYVLDRSVDETERIRRQSLLLDGPTSAMLDRAELAPGDRCLDVGCGPGEVMRQMGERVGAAGHVVGVDLDAAVGVAAAERLNASGPANYEFVAGDVLAAGLPAGWFDLVFARVLLLHLRDPVRALRRMWVRTAPGGMLGIVDFDLRTTSDGPIAELGRVSSAVFAQAGLNHDFGATVPACFERAGIGDPDGAVMTAMFAPMADMASYFAAVYRSLLPAAVRFGVADEARGTAFLADLEARDGTDREYVVGPLIVSAWKRKAREEDT
jgi:ubiquinone/menaquinone biosynthesis C-methylase UbiE